MNWFRIQKIALLFLLSLPYFKLYAAEKELMLVVEQTAGTLGFYDSVDGRAHGSVQVGFLPHEVIVSSDQKTAYVSNFGLQDYDETIGEPGTSISVIDIPSRLEKFRLYTFDAKAKNVYAKIDKAPHGMRLRPPFEKQLYVNTEKGNKLLVFDLSTQKIIKKFNINPHTHNFIFSPDGKVLWLMAGKEGVIRMDPDTGEITGQVKLATPVRGLSYTPRHQHLMASGNNEIVLIDPDNLNIDKRFGNLNVGQILYSDMTPNQKYIVAPAVWDSQAIVIDTDEGKVIKRVVTGLDPVTVKISPSGQFAYVTNARDDHVTAINLSNFESHAILTKEGPNGLALIKFSPKKSHQTLTLGVPLPLSGKNGQKGREMMMGYEFWKLKIRQAGGLMWHDAPCDLNLIYLDTESNDGHIAKLTAELITKHKVDMLLSTLGTHAYQIEKAVAMQHHISITPMFIREMKWEPNDLAVGEDFFVTSLAFSKQFQAHYNLPASALSASAIEAGVALQQALLKPESLVYQSFMKLFLENHFLTFSSSAKQ